MKKYLPLLVLTLLLAPLFALAQATESAGFVPLTQNVEWLKQAGNANTLPGFLNDLYKLCIGVAAVLAVLQIMRAGIMYMGGDSVTEKKQAKDLIAMSIAGLILVLSPVIVFSIINPDILDLKIQGIDKLGVPGSTGGNNTNTTSSTSCDDYTSVTLVSGTSCTAAGEGWELAAPSCASCPTAQSGYVCCGKKATP